MHNNTPMLFCGKMMKKSWENALVCFTDQAVSVDPSKSNGRSLIRPVSLDPALWAPAATVVGLYRLVVGVVARTQIRVPLGRPNYHLLWLNSRYGSSTWVTSCGEHEPLVNSTQDTDIHRGFDCWKASLHLDVSLYSLDCDRGCSGCNTCVHRFNKITYWFSTMFGRLIKLRVCGRLSDQNSFLAILFTSHECDRIVIVGDLASMLTTTGSWLSSTSIHALSWLTAARWEERKCYCG